PRSTRRSAPIAVSYTRTVLSSEPDTVSRPSGENTTALTVNNLGNLSWKQGQLEEAEAIYQRALSGFQAILGPSHLKSELVSRNIHSLQHLRGT
ncbi:hypothetical protein C8A01DRAFT_21355, partial [Parachaetomium inaequale]